MKRIMLAMAVGLMFVGYSHSANKVEIDALNFSFTGTAELDTGTISVANISSAVISYSLRVDSGIMNTADYWMDLPAKSHFFNGKLTITTTTLQSQGTTYITKDITQPGVPRNVVILSSFNTAGPQITSVTVSGIAYVYGKNAVGYSTSEYISIVSTADAVAGRGNIAFAEISSITISGYDAVEDVKTGTHYICIGTSDKIGLTNGIDATNDIYHVYQNNVDSSSDTVNVPYGTITFATTPNGANDYKVLYKVRNGVKH